MYCFDMTITCDVTSRFVSSAVFSIKSISGCESIYIEKDNRKANAKSIIGLLSLCLARDDTVKVYTSDKALEDKICEIFAENI